MSKLSETREEIYVVSDQIGSPTYAGDLAEVLIKIVLSSSKAYGLYHFSNSGAISWYDFAVEIFNHFNKQVVVKPIKTKDYPTAAKRPEYSVLSTNRIIQEFGLNELNWRDSLKINLK